MGVREWDRDGPAFDPGRKKCVMTCMCLIGRVIVFLFPFSGLKTKQNLVVDNEVI